MTTRMLVTGAGGPSAVSFINALRRRDVEITAGDMDPYAAGLYLVPPERRWLLLPGAHPRFVDDLLERCTAAKITVIVPTVDFELLPLARRRAEFEQRGIKLLLAPQRTFELCLDKWELVSACAETCPVPRSAVYDGAFNLRQWLMPFFIKPRLGAGAKNVRRVDHEEALVDIPRDGSMIVQEWLGGREYSVDVLCSPDGEFLTAVPRSRLKIDSGIAVAGRTVHDERLVKQAADVARRLGVTYVANIQFREDDAGVAKLMDVNARFPGTMPLTTIAGVDMSCLAFDMLLGKTVPREALRFREVAIVRTWEDHVVEVSELAALEAVARTQRS